MNFLQRATRQLGLVERKGYVGYMDTEFFVRALTLREALANAKGFSVEASYSADSIVYGAVSSCAQNLSQVPFGFYQGEEDNPVVVRNSPWAPLFERPNPLMSRYQLWEATEIFLKLRGECLWMFQFNGRRPNGNIPDEIYPQDPARWEPIIDGENGLIAAWEYRTDKGEKVFFEHGTEVIQFKKYNPYNRYRGLSPLQACALSLRMGHNARLYNDMTMQNMGEPGGVLSTDQQLVESVARDIRTQFEARHQGPMKAKRLAILHSGLKYQQTALAPKDMEFLQTINLSTEDILAVLKVPKTEVFRYDDVRKETSEVQDRALWTKNLLPEMAYLEDLLWSEMFSRRGNQQTYGLFDTQNIPALQEDGEKKARIAQMYFAMGYPLNKINERFKLGMEDVEWGEVGFLPFNLMPADSVASGESGSDPTGPAAPSPEGGDEAEDEETDGLRRVVAGARNPLAPILLPAPKTQKSSQARRRQAALRFQVRLRPLEVRFMGRIKRFFFETRQALLEQFFKETRAVPQVVEHLILTLKQSRVRLDAIARPHIKQAIEAGGERLAEFDLEFNSNDPRVTNLLQRRTGKITGLVGTLEDQLRSQLVEGYEAGESVTSLANRVRDVMNFASSRSMTIARTEMSNAANQAGVLGEKQAGIEKHEWASADDEAVRESHQQVDGEIVELDTPFSNGLLYPGDPAGAPEEVINCRCTFLPVFS